MVIDCTDNPTTRQFVNTFAVANGIPLVSGGAVRSEGVVGVYHSILPPQPPAALPSSSGADERGPCYACVFPALAAGPATPGPDRLSAEVAEERAALLGTGNCSDEGVLGILCAVVGAVMGSEALRVLLGTGMFRSRLITPFLTSPW
jgi:adenylyltransferase/sulfurtransferase